MKIRIATLTLACIGAASLAASPVQAEDLAWTHYRPGNTGIPGDYTQAIYVDADDLPWIAAYIPFWEEGGMAHFDGDAWCTVSSFDHPEIVSPRFNDIISDAAGIMWIASDHGLLSYDPAVGPDSLVRYDADNTPMPISQIADIALAPDGALWIAIHDVNDVPPGGLARFDPAAQTWDVWTTDNGLPWGAEWPGWDYVDFVDAAPDAGGGFTIWFGSREMGMATYKDGVFEWFGNDFVPPGGPMTPRGLPSHNALDNLGNLWMTTNRGLARRAPDGSYLVTGYPDGLGSEVARVSALRDGRAVLGTYYADVYVYDGGWSYIGNWGGGSHTYAFAEDSTGAIWTGGIGGAAKYEDGQWQQYRLTNTGMLGYWIETIDFDAAGNVYMNGNAGPGVGGFNIFDGVHWIGVNDANYGMGPPWGQPSDDVTALCARRSGTVAVAPMFNGLLDFDGQNYTTLIPQGYGIDHVAEDGLERLWAAREYGYGVFRVTGTEYVQYIYGNSPFPGGEITDIVVDEANPGFVWIASAFGVSYTDGDVWTVYPRELFGLDRDSTGYHVWSFDVGPDGTFWVGSGIGLINFDPVTSTNVTHTKTNSSLPSNDIHNVEVTPDGSVWVTTFDRVYPYPGGLTRFDGETSTTWTMTDSPLPHNQVWVLASRPVVGGYELWIGTASEAVAVVTVMTAVPGDANGDGVIDFGDLLVVLGAWGPCTGDCPADLDGDGVVSFTDLLIVLSNWS